MQEFLKHEEITRKIIECAMRVHTELGNGFQEIVYQRALEIEMSLSDIAFEREKAMSICYKGMAIAERRVDFLLNN